MTEPSTHASINASITSCHPKISPADAISFTSPPPIALPDDKNQSTNKNRLTQTAPIMCDTMFCLSAMHIAAPITANTILRHNGISNVLSSIIVKTIRTEVMRQYSTLFILIPFAMKTIMYSMPLSASIKGYCFDIFAPQFRHLPFKMM